MAIDKIKRAFQMLDEFVESKFKRVPRGRAGGGQFTFGIGKPKSTANAPVRSNKPASFKVRAAKKAWEGIHARRAAAGHGGGGAAPKAAQPAPDPNAPKRKLTRNVNAAMKAWVKIRANREAAAKAKAAGQPFVPPVWVGKVGTTTARQKRQAAMAAQQQQQQQQREAQLRGTARKVATWRKKAALKAWENMRAKKAAAAAAAQGQPVAPVRVAPPAAAAAQRPVPGRPAPAAPPAAPPAAAAPAAKPGRLSPAEREAIVKKHVSSHGVKGRLALNGGINKFDIIEFDDGHKAGFKPAGGEEPGDGWQDWLQMAIQRHDQALIDEIKAIPKAERDQKFVKRVRPHIPYGRQTEREVGAWEVAKLVGLDDLAVPVIDGKVEGNRGAVVELHPGEDAYKVPYDKRFDGDENVRRVAMFDYIIGNTDRHAKNWRIDVKAGANKILMIDHGLAFPEGEILGVGNQQIMQEAADLEHGPKPGDAPAKYAKIYADKKNEIRAALVKLKFNQRVIDGAMARIDKAQGVKNWGELHKVANKVPPANPFAAHAITPAGPTPAAPGRPSTLPPAPVRPAVRPKTSYEQARTRGGGLINVRKDPLHGPLVSGHSQARKTPGGHYRWVRKPKPAAPAAAPVRPVPVAPARPAAAPFRGVAPVPVAPAKPAAKPKSSYEQAHTPGGRSVKVRKDPVFGPMSSGARPKARQTPGGKWRFVRK